MGGGDGIGPSNGNINGDGSRVETERVGMDPTAERILISVASIGMAPCTPCVSMFLTANTAVRRLHSSMLCPLDGLADNEEVEGSRGRERRVWRILKRLRLQDPLSEATELAEPGRHNELTITPAKLS